MCCLAVLFTACEDFATEDNPTPSYISINTSNVQLKLGDTFVRKAIVAGSAVVTYSSSDETIATVDQEGKVTGIAVGTATITVEVTGYNAAGKKIYIPEEKSYKVTVSAAWAANEYNEASWDGTKVVFTKQTAASVTPVTDATANVTWGDGYYTVSGNVTITGNVLLGADTHLILQDGAKLTINGRIYGDLKNLRIYGQANQTGQLVVTASGDGISSINTLEVHSCQVKSTASLDICGGFYYISTFNVYGGSVDAECTGNGYGICLASTSSMNIYGGEVKAVGKGNNNNFSYGIMSSTVTVYGGKLWAESAGYKALKSNITLTKGGGFTGKIEYSSDKSAWSETVDNNAKYVRVGY